MPPEQTQADLELVPTSDGSSTLLHTGFNQTYHSINGALQEARHVFLQQGLQYFLDQKGTGLDQNGTGLDQNGTGLDQNGTGLEQNGRNPDQSRTNAASVLEVGFGTGLNFLVSAAYCLQNGISLDYTGIEPFPVNPETLRQTNYGDFLPGDENKEAFLAWYPGEEPLYLPGTPGAPAALGSSAASAASGTIHLNLILKPVLETGPLPPADIVYFDAFAPATQPEMWTAEVISHVVAGLKTGGVFVSYSITGNLKRILKGLGFRVEKPRGAAGKREMIRAVKI